MAKKKCLPKQKLSRQKTKLLMRSGGELDEIMMSSVIEKMNKGGNAKRIVAKNGKEKMQSYKMGGWAYSGKKK